MEPRSAYVLRQRQLRGDGIGITFNSRLQRRERVDRIVLGQEDLAAQKQRVDVFRVTRQNTIQDALGLRVFLVEGFDARQPDGCVDEVLSSLRYGVTICARVVRSV